MLMSIQTCWTSLMPPMAYSALPLMSAVAQTCNTADMEVRLLHRPPPHHPIFPTPLTFFTLPIPILPPAMHFC